MHTIAESKQLVQESLSTDADHDAILASLHDEIDQHNRSRARSRRHSRRPRASSQDDRDQADSALRFRFKHDKHYISKERRRRKERKHSPVNTQAEAKVDEADHPFPREPKSPTDEPSDDAFLSSLLDALADDEAASYWESVYSQPIHTYERPTVQTETGSIERMDDEEYAAWVKRKMWEKSHPEIVAERNKMEARRREEAELKQKRRDDFVRQRQKEAWTQASRARSPDDHAYVFDFSTTNSASHNARQQDRTKEWKQAWMSYLEAWEKLKAVDLSSYEGDVTKLLPWPVLRSKPPTRPHIHDFLQNMPYADAETRRRLLKVERVRWHPDKIQHRLGGRVDEGTMKVVTSIFQIIDTLWTEEVAKS